jgi:hypothetical protein
MEADAALVAGGDDVLDADDVVPGFTCPGQLDL